MPGNRGNRITIKINEDRFDCTPRQSLETQGSATGKQVEASTALDDDTSNVPGYIACIVIGFVRRKSY